MEGPTESSLYYHQYMHDMFNGDLIDRCEPMIIPAVIVTL